MGLTVQSVVEYPVGLTHYISGAVCHLLSYCCTVEEFYTVSPPLLMIVDGVVRFY